MKAAGNVDDFPYSWSVPGWHPPTQHDKQAKVCNGTDSVQGNDGVLHMNIVCPVNPADQPGGDLPDLQTTAYATSLLRQFAKSQQSQVKAGGTKQPWFLAVGYHKPHIPLKYPEKYRSLYPLDSVPLPTARTKPEKMPAVAWDSWDDVRSRDDVASLNVSWPYGPMPDSFSKLIRQSYFAAVSYIDDQVIVVIVVREGGAGRAVQGGRGVGRILTIHQVGELTRTMLTMHCTRYTPGGRVDTHYAHYALYSLYTRWES
jgi:iduronate 2-sulfatase